MKQYISRFLKSVAVVFLAFPVLYILLAALVFDVPMEECFGILLSPFYYLVCASVIAAGYGFWEMRRWGWYAFLISQVLVIYENAVIVQRYSASHHKVMAFLVVLTVQLILVYRISREIRVPYFFPNIRWWESNPGYRLEVPVEFSYQRDTSGTRFKGNILDISPLGCFIKTRDEVIFGESFFLRFEVFGRTIDCEGTAVWLAEAAVTYPKGIGIKFQGLDRRQKRNLRMIARRLKRVALLYRKYRYWMSSEEFSKKLAEVESGNFVPKGALGEALDNFRKPRS